MLKLNKAGWIALVVLIVGGLNWGLVGFFDFNLIAVVFGEMSLLSRVIYCIVGLATVYTIFEGLLSYRVKSTGTHKPHPA